MNKNYCDELTENILDCLPPMRVIVFKSGEDIINKWAKNKTVEGRYSYCPKSKHHMFYYSKKENR